MKITYEEILKLKVLKRGDLISINGVIYEVAKTGEGYKLWSDEKLGYEELSFLIEKNFEKLRQRKQKNNAYQEFNMLFADEDLLKTLGLKVGDKIKIGYTYKIENVNNKIKLVSMNHALSNVLEIKELINTNFEKVEGSI